MMVAAGLEPIEPYPGAGKSWRCRCASCGVISRPVYNNVRRGQGRCKSCGSQAGGIRRMRAGADTAVKTMLAARLRPLVPYPGRNSPWRCVCLKCGDEIAPRLGSVARGSGCGSCATSGFRSDRPAIVYLVAHPVAGAHKIGIANVGSGRLTKHARRGWIVYRTLACDRGKDAQRIERETLRWLRVERSLPAFLADGDGFTETVDAASIELRTVWRKVLAEAK
jgi:hypothetical protein